MCRMICNPSLICPQLHDQIIAEFTKDAEAAVKTSFCRDSLKSLQTVREMTETIKTDAVSFFILFLCYTTENAAWKILLLCPILYSDVLYSNVLK